MYAASAAEKDAPRKLRDHPPTASLETYNVEVETDPDTIKSTVINHITILRGVFLEASKAVNVRESGLESAARMLSFK